MILKYSIIVPIYNAEKTLRRCLDSILAEKRTDIELILVNDGSKDASGAVCKEYAESISIVQLIDKENGGVSTARNAGLDVAAGKYILFVDSDDYVTPRFFSALDNALEAHNCDWIQFSCCFDNGQELRERVHTPFHAEGRERMMTQLINDICKKQLNPPWAKLYRRDLIEAHNIRFPVGASVGEDRAFNIKYSMYIQSYAVTEQILYYVNTENENSLTRSRHKDLQAQFDVTKHYFSEALQTAPISEAEKEQYQKAVNFGDCRGIYHDAKLLHQDHVSWLARQKRLGELCDEINRKKMKYPKTRFCTLITLPVRLRMTMVIDAMAWKLTH